MVLSYRQNVIGRLKALYSVCAWYFFNIKINTAFHSISGLTYIF